MSSAAAVRKNREFDPNTFLAMIHYNGGLQVHSSLLNVVLHD
jgi:hypothetical protein